MSELPSSGETPLPRESAQPVSAYDRVQEREPEASGEMSWSWLAGLVFFIAGVVGVWMWVNRAPEAAEPDLYRLVVSASEDFRPSAVTDDPDRAASFVLETFGLPLFPPELDGFTLLGAGAAEIASGVEVPAFRYDGADGATVVVYVYDYIFLDDTAREGILRLAPEVYARLAEPEPVDSRRVDGSYVVTWRRRASIFSAVAPGEASAEQLLQSVRRAEI